MSRLRIGIDVGGTNTDAVIVDEDGAVRAATKTPTTEDPLNGIRTAIAEVLAHVDRTDVVQAMLGTTHPANAIIQRRGLGRVGVLRLAAPASFAVLPGAAWPDDLLEQVVGPTAIIGGGYEFDGREIAPLDEAAVGSFARRCLDDGVAAVAVASPFSPANDAHEQRARVLLEHALGDSVPVSLSHEVGSLGLLERENATVLNAALHQVAARVVTGFRDALRDESLHVAAFLTQNDGTLIEAAEAIRLPVLTLGSGPTNSMRGAAALAGVTDAVVIDVGGTSSDVGVLVDGFPRESAAAVEVGGVRTNFRMPDLLSIGLGGGTVVRVAGNGDVVVGPDSVGYRVVDEALVRGGDTVTLSDVSTLSGRLAGFGDSELLAGLAPDVAAKALTWVDEQVARMAARMRASRLSIPLVAVGGGSHLVGDAVPDIGQVIRPRHHEVANAYGAAIAEVSGSVDRIYRFDDGDRNECLEQARQLAIAAAVRAGGDEGRVRITSLVEVPLTYVPGKASRVIVKAAGPLRVAEPVGAA